jgi:hypothetical protein
MKISIKIHHFQENKIQNIVKISLKIHYKYLVKFHLDFLTIKNRRKVNSINNKYNQYKVRIIVQNQLKLYHQKYKKNVKARKHFNKQFNSMITLICNNLYAVLGKKTSRFKTVILVIFNRKIICLNNQ